VPVLGEDSVFPEDAYQRYTSLAEPAWRRRRRSFARRVGRFI
jgi:hypothetical protein